MTYNVYLSLGSNMGESARTLQAAWLKITESAKITGIKLSHFVVTKPWGVTDQPDFLNCVGLIRTTFEPVELLHYLQKIELGFGRTREVHWGPRTLDIDIIYIVSETGSLIEFQNEELVVPHPYFWERLFVLEPLMEITPDFSFKDVKIHDRVQALKLAEQ